MKTVKRKLVAVEISRATAISYNQTINVGSHNQLFAQLKLSFQNFDFFGSQVKSDSSYIFFKLAWAIIKTYVITFGMSFYAGAHALSDINESIGIRRNSVMLKVTSI